MVRLYLLAVGVQFIWALNNNVTKFALKGFPPLLLAGLRASIAAVLLVALYLVIRSRPFPLRDLPKLIVLGAMGIGLNQFFFVVGINRTSVTHASFILQLTPIVTMLMSGALGQERITIPKIAGTAIAFLGVVLLQLTKAEGEGASLAGDAMLCIGVVSFASYIVFGKRATARYDAITVTTIAYVGSSLGMLPLTIWQGRGFDFTQVPAIAWASVAYMAIFSSIIGYLLYYYVLTHMEPSRVSQFSYLQPVMATSIAAVLLGEPVTLWLAVSGGLVLLGVFVAEKARWR